MDGQPGSGREITLEELLELRAKTEAISKSLKARLEDHLDTLKPLFAPKLLLGEFVRGGEKGLTNEAERNFDRLQEAYAKAAGSLSLPSKLEHPIDPIPNKPALYPWEYSHALDGSTAATVRSPVSWVLSFASPVGLSEARRMAAEKGRSAASLKTFAVHCLAMVALFARNPGLGRLFAALRFETSASRSPELGSLEMIRLTAPLSSFRPADHLILQAVRLSGIPEFQELVDPALASQSLEDPLRRLLA